MTFFAPFCIPFMVGAAVMFVVLLWKWGSWLCRLPRADKKRILFGLPTRRTLAAVWEVISESLLHRRIFKVNPLLGYMHMSLAFGWFLLIAVGWIETIAYLGFRYVPLQGHVFFKYFATGLEHKPVFDFLMDLLLLFVLSGVALAWGKRVYSRAMGMRRTTRHVLGDRVALSALWFVFPVRLIAESTTCALYGGGGFLTGSLGAWLAGHVGVLPLMNFESAAWWFYSSCLGVGRRVDGGARQHARADESRKRGMVGLFRMPRYFLRGVAFLAVYAYLYRDSPDLPAALRTPLDRKGGGVRSFSGRSMLALRYLHRSLSVAERAGNQ